MSGDDYIATHILPACDWLDDNQDKVPTAVRNALLMTAGITTLLIKLDPVTAAALMLRIIDTADAMPRKPTVQ